MATVKVKVGEIKREVTVADEQCPYRHCFHPHDVPVQGAGGVRSSAARWLCLTNARQGCPEPLPEPKPRQEQGK